MACWACQWPAQPASRLFSLSGYNTGKENLWCPEYCWPGWSAGGKFKFLHQSKVVRSSNSTNINSHLNLKLYLSVINPKTHSSSIPATIRYIMYNYIDSSLRVVKLFLYIDRSTIAFIKTQ